jgi:hypothetical protein
MVEFIRTIFLKVFDKLLEKYWKKGDDKSPSPPTIINTMETLARIYSIMDDTLEETEFDRFLILKSENGGGIPKLGNHLYTSVIMERHTVPAKVRAMDLYKKIELDRDYITMLTEIYVSGKKRFKVDEMPQGLLKRIYNSEGVKFSKVYHLYTAENAMFYCSVATRSTDTPNENDLLMVDLNVSLISNIFKETLANEGKMEDK